MIYVLNVQILMYVKNVIKEVILLMIYKNVKNVLYNMKNVNYGLKIANVKVSITKIMEEVIKFVI